MHTCLHQRLGEKKQNKQNDWLVSESHSSKSISTTLGISLTLRNANDLRRYIMQSTALYHTKYGSIWRAVGLPAPRLQRLRQDVSVDQVHQPPKRRHLGPINWTRKRHIYSELLRLYLKVWGGIGKVWKVWGGIGKVWGGIARQDKCPKSVDGMSRRHRIVSLQRIVTTFRC